VPKPKRIGERVDVLVDADSLKRYSDASAVLVALELVDELKDAREELVGEVEEGGRVAGALV